jgi:hypothetical protein
MSITTCLVTGTIVAPDGVDLGGAAFHFVPEPVVFGGQGDTVIAPRTVRTVADGDGAVSVHLAPGRYRVGVSLPGGLQIGFSATVPASPTANLNAIRDVAPPPVPGLNAVTVRDLLAALGGSDGDVLTLSGGTAAWTPAAGGPGGGPGNIDGGNAGSLYTGGQVDGGNAFSIYGPGQKIDAGGA